MKRNFFKGFLALATGLAFVACGNDNDGGKKNIDNNNNNGNINASTKFVHKTLIENMTGAWCGACPSMASAIATAQGHSTLGSKVISISVHRGDAMQTNQSNNFIGNYVKFDTRIEPGSNEIYFPFSMLNRTVGWPGNAAAVYNSVNQEGSPIGIKIESNLSNTGGTVNATFKFNSGYQDLSYHIVILEQDVKINQAQTGSSQGANYIHKNVFRYGLDGYNGTSLGTVTAGQEVVKNNQSVSYTLIGNDVSKAEVVVFVTDKDGKVLNVQKAKANQTQDYEVVK